MSCPTSDCSFPVVADVRVSRSIPIWASLVKNGHMFSRPARKIQFGQASIKASNSDVLITFPPSVLYVQSPAVEFSNNKYPTSGSAFKIKLADILVLGHKHLKRLHFG